MENQQVPNLGRIIAVYNRLIEYIEKYEKEKDSRAIFTYVYSIMTKTIIDNFNSAQFEDPESMITFTETFAGYYFAALEAYDKDKIAPRGWQKAFNTILKRQTSVMEDMVIGVYVHIIQDLVLAVYELNSGAPKNHVAIGDYHKINDLLQKIINTVQDDVAKRYDPYLNIVDILVRREALIFTNDGIRVARTISWYNASRMMDEKLRAEVITSIEESVNDFIDGIRNNHSWVVKIAFSFLRFILNLSRRWSGQKLAIEHLKSNIYCEHADSGPGQDYVIATVSSSV